ncbi:hypothetical protein F0A16_06910 [Salinicola corii]|uniref:GGDEF domain-containing protein n=1 Tax=Salinicola corii TaxID=2606937 RepID=A0A640WFR6_9GAMM|nr:hypothetical protein [Salinicola corii]KAA0019075.1 hypothetical protein F0A16_06910 [Salinicola corii]
MQSKYKSLGSRTLLSLLSLLALLAGWLAEDATRVVAWIGCIAFALLTVRPSRLSHWLPIMIALLSIALLATHHASSHIWLWALPLCLLGLPGRAGVTASVLIYVLSVIYVGWTLPLPTAVVAGIALAIVWLLCLDRQRVSAKTPADTQSSWLLPAAQLDSGIQRELKRAERESLHAEVTVFGCARSTTADMAALCRRLQEALTLYERAYRLNDYGIAVIVVATSAETAKQRRQQLRHAIAPHKEVSSTPLTEIGNRFANYHGKRSSPVPEVQPWH